MGTSLVPEGFQIARVDGVDIVLSGVDVTADGIDVHWDARPNHVTRGLDREWDSAMADWTQRMRSEGKDAAGGPPPMPGNLLARVQAVVVDDLGTDYVARTGQAAGSDTEWQSRWHYTPAPPAAARLLRLSFAVDGVRTSGCDVPLA